jgi:hypothetical protein
MKDWPTVPSPGPESTPVIVLVSSSTTVPFRLPKRLPRWNGDTRRRKRRLREKLAKLDAIRYGPAIKTWTRMMTKRFDYSFYSEVGRYCESRIDWSRDVLEVNREAATDGD